MPIRRITFIVLYKDFNKLNSNYKDIFNLIKEEELDLD
jgi:hypothetical protein